MIAGNRADLNHLQVIPSENADTMAEKEGLPFLESLALEALNAEKEFQSILLDIFQIISNNEQPLPLSCLKALPLILEVFPVISLRENQS
ncbi:Small GTPase superfamily [Trema orientale]|uniref:Small GTPase superfamily n=1 Tax=Trema orientale TaxID=63057 RepID=A0A2P5BYN2_TREOI|nr:Small GTPase superfamily [Trema orientale]